MMSDRIRVTTESGSVYEFRGGLTQVRRVNDSHTMRKDGKWVECKRVVCYMGEPMGLLLSGVAPLGDTMRVTTPVVAVEGIEEGDHRPG